ncbi:unnamed protein product, partial [Rotaria magnacalcarata]
YVRREACKALGNLGEKAATIEVIAALIDATRDENREVGVEACEALGNLGEKAATSEVIAALINTTRDADSYVRGKACEILRNLGKKAATNEVITALIDATCDGDSYVRREACKALGNLGEKTATIEVIAALIDATRDENREVGVEACAALRNLGEKAATSELIDSLVNFISTIDDSDDIVVGALVRAMCSYDGMRALNLETIGKLWNCIRKSSKIDFTPIPLELLLGLFLNSGDVSWLRLVAYVALLQGVGVTVGKNIVRIYDTKGMEEFEMCDPELVAIFTEVFTDQRRKIEPDFSFGKESAS